MLKSRKNIHAGLFGTTSKFGYFLALKYMVFLTYKHKKNPQNEVRHHFCVHNRVQNLILIILGKKK